MADEVDIEPINGDAIIKAFIVSLAKDSYKKDTLEKDVRFQNVISLYQRGYRHSYSDMLNTLTEIRKNLKHSSDIEILYQNLNMIKNVSFSCQEDNNVQKKLYKFYDHMALELARLDLLDKANENQKALNEKNQEISKALKNASDKIEKLNEQTINIKAEFVTILSVFAAIILAFAGGLGLNNEILRNLHQVPMYKLSMMAMIIGFILFNTIFGLMHIVAKIIGKDIAHKCNRCSTGNCDTEKADVNCNPFTKVRLRYPYVYYVNTFFVIGIFGILAAWLIDIKIIVAYIRNGVEWNLYNQTELIFTYGIGLLLLIVSGHWYLKKSRAKEQTKALIK